MKKNFDEWNKLKKEIDFNLDRPPIYHTGDIWWTSIGYNIGVENNGKNNMFGRPVIILKKINQYSCLIVPLSSKIKEGYFYHSFCFKDVENTILFNQIRVIDTSRLIDYVGQISENKFSDIKDRFIQIFR